MFWDLEFILVLAVIVTGAMRLLYRFVLYARRPPTARKPWYIEWSYALFPILLIVLVLRTFAVEPFRIPSGSMMPTLLIGDLILVNKFAYGLRIPVLHTKIVKTGTPERGDVAVFRFPGDPNIDYIKRVIGLPGDEVVYQSKQLLVNGQLFTQSNPRPFDDVYTGRHRPHHTQLTERVGETQHEILRDSLYVPQTRHFQVPPGQFLVMGDNRDHSSDSRVWGFVPEDHLVGQAFWVWMNFDFLIASLTRPEVSLLSRLGEIH